MNRIQRVPMRPKLAAIALLGATFGLIFWFVWGNRDDRPQLIVYCAHDSIYSQEILDRFEAKSGISIIAKFDTEATKSLGLVELIESESGAPNGDVFWNNELLGTIRLASSGCLEPYQSPNASRFPLKFKDPQGLWTGFAGRLRVFIANRDLMEATGDAALRLLASPDLSKVAIAKPLYGTTLTHYAALWAETGSEELKAWHLQSRELGIIESAGNAVVKDLVAKGVCHLGYTDTDDTFAAIDAGAPVAMLPARLPSGKTICIPNTISIIKNGPHPDSAKKFVDFLLSEETELLLARGNARQIPLGKLAPDADLPAKVKAILAWAADGTDLKTLAPARDECLAWLKTLTP